MAKSDKKEVKIYECLVCKFKSTDKAAFKTHELECQHRSNAHSEKDMASKDKSETVAKNKCELCGMVRTSPKDLKNHVLKHHTEHNCELCERSIRSFIHLN